MRAAVSCALFLLFLAAPTDAQDPVFPVDRLAWDIPSLTLTGAVVQDHRFYLDGVTKAIPVTPTCTPAVPPMTCTATLPALTTGPHTIVVSYRVMLSDGRVIESERSAPFTFTLFLGLPAPTSLRIVPGA